MSHCSKIWFIINLESPKISSCYMPISMAICRPIINAWYSATLLEQRSLNENEYRSICLCGETNTTPAPAPSWRAAPLKKSSIMALLQCKIRLHSGNHQRTPNQIELGDQLRNLPMLVLWQLFVACMQCHIVVARLPIKLYNPKPLA